jgi:hypothetical protein
MQKHPSECFVLLYRLDLVTECGAVAHYIIIPNSGELSAQYKRASAWLGSGNVALGLDYFGQCPVAGEDPVFAG